MRKWLINLQLWFSNIWNINKIISKKDEQIKQQYLKNAGFVRKLELLNNNQENLLREIEFLKSQVFLSVDISPKGYDPTVVCLSYRDKNGENIARFFDFPRGTNLKEVEDYLKHFKKSNVYIDGPYGMSRHFN